MSSLTDILTALKQGVVAINSLATAVKSGSNSFTALIQLPSYTVATVPPAASWTGALIYVSNESGGAVPAFSDSVSWRRVTDRAVIS